MNRREAIKDISFATGLALCPSIITGLLSGCQSPNQPNYKLMTLNSSQDKMVTILAEMIIPATDTPGAKAAKVNQFIDLMLTKWMQNDEKESFLTGLSQLNKRSMDLFNKPFVEISDENQLILLNELKEEYINQRESGHGGGNTFFTLLKSLTVSGYYTSEIGASKELKYVMMPGYYDGDVPYSKIGKAYSM